MHMFRRLLARYRATGADLPGGDMLRAHGVAMEGHFWRSPTPRQGARPSPWSASTAGLEHGSLALAATETTRRGATGTDAPPA